jgi:hypothetical protein
VGSDLGRYSSPLCGAKMRCRVCGLVFFCGWLGCAPVLVDQSAEDSVASGRGIEGDHGGRIVGRRVLVKPLVRPVVIEMAHVPVQHGVGVSFVVDQHPVGAFGADAADESFRVAVRPGCPGRAFDDVDTFGGEDGVEGVGELGVREDPACRCRVAGWPAMAARLTAERLLGMDGVRQVMTHRDPVTALRWPRWVCRSGGVGEFG